MRFGLSDLLFNEGLLTLQQLEEIEENDTDDSQAKLLKHTTGDSCKCSKFIKALKNTDQEHVANLIKNPKGM